MGSNTNEITFFCYFVSALDRFFVQMPLLATALRPWLKWRFNIGSVAKDCRAHPRSVKLGEGFMMKFKPNQTRTYDGEGFKKRAACLCFKNEREDEVWRSRFLCDSSIGLFARFQLIWFGRLTSKWVDLHGSYPSHLLIRMNTYMSLLSSFYFR